MYSREYNIFKDYLFMRTKKSRLRQCTKNANILSNWKKHMYYTKKKGGEERVIYLTFLILAYNIVFLN